MLSTTMITTAARSSLHQALRSPALSVLDTQRMLGHRHLSTTPLRLNADKDQVNGKKHPKGSYLLFHPVYSESDLDAVKITHRKPKTRGDRMAGWMVWLARSVFDFATRYPSHQGKFPIRKSAVDKKVGLPSHIASQSSNAQSLVKDGEAVKANEAAKIDAKDVEEGMTLEEMRRKGIVFGPDGWLNRIVALEALAGCPGMVAATVRHLQSLRLMKRDKGWIHTMLEDAENERMHLLTFMTLAKPRPIARAFVLLTQGVFYNFFFVFYLFAPKVAHRFVGVLEEEAVMTYTYILEDLECGRLPEWENVPAPEIAIEYWQLPKNAMLVDVIKAVRADEATHRHINHTFASLESTDPNPFAYRDPPPKMRGETYGLERDEALEWAKREKSQEVQASEKTA